jgi:16S rRNA (guanine1516-N2)-methyltransferase
MLTLKNKIVVVAASEAMVTKAKELACQLDLPFITSGHNFYPFLLVVTPKRLELQESKVKNAKPIYVDFFANKLKHRLRFGGGNQQLIAKAVGIKGGVRPTVVDATAGLGTDACVLAALGCEVVMLERSPIVGALLQDGLERFRSSSQASVNQIRLDLYILSAKNYMDEIMQGQVQRPDVIYLDPMYPKRRKSALGKKSMRVLHELVGEDEDIVDVFNLALQCAAKRVVVKRPSYAASLGERQPDLVFSAGGSCRYDVYFTSISL